FSPELRREGGGGAERARESLLALAEPRAAAEKHQHRVQTLLRARRTRGRQRQQCSAPRPAGAILAEPLLHETGIPRERLGLAQSYPLLRYGTAEVSAGRVSGREGLEHLRVGLNLPRRKLERHAERRR